MGQSTETNSASQKSELIEKLKIEDQLKHYQEGRTDVRAYATFLVQIITLLLTTMILVMGWIAKDYATEKYRLAQRAVIPQTASVSQGIRQDQIVQKPIYEIPPDQAEGHLQIEERKFSYINRVYWRLLIYSPTTSLLLAGFSTFTLLVLGLLIAITYQLQRRRYHYHALGLKLGLENDQPVADAILIRGALNDLMILIGLAALGLIALTIIQTFLYIFYADLWAVKVSLVLVLLLVIAKTFFVGQMAFSYTHFERTEGWRSRWQRAHRRIKELQAMLEKQPNCPTIINEALTRLEVISSNGSKAQWQESGALLHTLLVELRKTDFGSQMEDHANALVMELRHNKIWRRTPSPLPDVEVADESDCHN